MWIAQTEKINKNLEYFKCTFVQLLFQPNGALFMSTMNRTAKSYAFAIVAAEHAMGWLPVGTHDWSRFLTPSELSLAIRHVGLTVYM